LGTRQVDVVKLKDLEGWLTPSEAAARIGMSRQGLHKVYLDNGKLRAVRAHAGWLIDPADVDRVAQERASGRSWH
jgi:predicted site-specific integrase-resolvase